MYNEYLRDLIDDDRIDDSNVDNDKKLIMINKLLPDLLKNNPDSKIDSKQIIKKIFNEKDKNVVLLDNNIISDGGGERL